MSNRNNIQWHHIADTFSDPGPGMAQSWSTHVGRGQDGTFRVWLDGDDEDTDDEDNPDDDRGFRVGSAAELVEWIECDASLDLTEVVETLRNVPDMQAVVQLIDARFAQFEDDAELEEPSSPDTPEDEPVVDPPSPEDPAAPRDGDLPSGAVFACAYTVTVMPFDIQEAAFFRRTGTTDELWVTQSPHLSFDDQVSGPQVSLQSLAGTRSVEVACDVSGPVQGDPRAACLTLLGHLIRGRVGFYWPGKFITSGIVSQDDFNGLVDEIERELDGNAERARQNEPDIVKVARELGLDPSPTGKGPDSWKASCPGTNHPIYISAAAEEFGCGWCKRKGSSEVLRDFVAERKRKR